MTPTHFPARRALHLAVCALLSSAPLAFFGTAHAQQQAAPAAAGAPGLTPEMDRPTARAMWKHEWYNEGSMPVGVRAHDKGGKNGGPWSAAFRRDMLNAAARERAKWGRMIPGVAGTGTELTAAAAGGTTLAAATAATGTTWANLGPTRADVAKNGGTSLAITDAGRVSAVVIDPQDPNVIYGGFAGGGVWKTVNGGASWTSLTESLGTLSVGALALDPRNRNAVYLGLGDAFDGTGIGLMKSNDGGASWAGPFYLGDSTVINALVVHPQNSAVVLAATNTGLFRSVDAGLSWARVGIATGGAGNPYVWSIASTGGSGFVVALEANPTATTGTTDGQIWVTSDAGNSWSKASGVTAATGVGRITVAAASNGTTLYAMGAVPNATGSSDLADLFKSTNGGLSWTALGAPKRRYKNTNRESSSLATLLGGQGWYNQAVLVDPANPNVAYFGGQLLLAKTTDGGSSFSQMTNWLAQYNLPYAHADFHAAAMVGSKLIVGTDGGLFQSTNGGTTFTDQLNVGLTTHLVYSVGSTPARADAIVGGFQDNGTRVRKLDATGVGSSTFNQYLGGDGFGSAIHRTNGSTMLGSLYYTRIYKSTDGGATFALASTGITESNNASAAPFNTGITNWEGAASADTVFTWVNTKVYKSTNFAGSWTALGTTGFPTTAYYLRGVAVAKGDVNRIGVVASGGKAYLSTNGGSSWTACGALPNNGLSLSKMAFDTVDPSTLYVASVAATTGVSHLWRSTDNCASFTAIDGASGFPAGVPVNTIRVDPNNRDALYAGTHLGVYRSLDRGTTWARYGSGMPLVNVEDIYVAPDSGVVRAATFGRGFWQLN